jgi:type II secretory pathway component PulF
LGKALKTSLGHRLTPSFLGMIARAEQDGELCAVLPLVANSVHISSGLRTERRNRLLYPILIFSILFTTFFLLASFIYPKFMELFHELAGEGVPSTAERALHLSCWLMTCGIPSGRIIPAMMIITAAVIFLRSFMRNPQLLTSVLLIYYAAISVIGSLAMIYLPLDYFYYDDEQIYFGIVLALGLFIVHLATACIIGSGDKYARYVVAIIPGIIITVMGLCDMDVTCFFIAVALVLAFPLVVMVPVVKVSCGALAHLGERGAGFFCRVAGITWFNLLPLAGLAAGMYVHLASGKGMAESAELCRDTVARPWLRRRLDRFIAEVRAGEPWADAWARMKLGSPLHEWMVRNAAARENPAEGFFQLTAWLNEEICRKHRLFLRFAEVAGILFNAALVALFVLGMFEVLVDTIRFLSLETY